MATTKQDDLNELKKIKSQLDRAEFTLPDISEDNPDISGIDEASEHISNAIDFLNQSIQELEKEIKKQ